MGAPPVGYAPDASVAYLGESPDAEPGGRIAVAPESEEPHYPPVGEDPLAAVGALVQEEEAAEEGAGEAVPSVEPVHEGGVAVSRAGSVPCTDDYGEAVASGRSCLEGPEESEASEGAPDAAAIVDHTGDVPADAADDAGDTEDGRVAGVDDDEAPGAPGPSPQAVPDEAAARDHVPPGYVEEHDPVGPVAPGRSPGPAGVIVAEKSPDGPYAVTGAAGSTDPGSAAAEVELTYDAQEGVHGPGRGVPEAGAPDV